jgi:hypothetical protein
MNNNFNLHRFGKYFAYDLKRQWKNLGMLMLIFALFPVIFYLLYMFFAVLLDGGMGKIFLGLGINGPSVLFRAAVGIFAAAIFLMIFPARAYGEITDKAKGSEWLLLPVSRLEKFTSMMLTTLVVIPLVYFTIYFFSDFIVCLLDKSCGNALISIDINDLMDTSDFVIASNGLWLLIVNVMENAILFLLGGLLFKKWKVVGTLLANFGIGMVFSSAFSIFLANTDLIAFGDWAMDWVQRHADNLDVWLNAWIDIWFLVIMLLFGAMSWIRLKRIQH